jgi:hypothetical protein
MAPTPDTMMPAPESPRNAQRIALRALQAVALLLAGTAPAVAETLGHTMTGVWIPATALGLTLITAAGGNRK